MAGKATRTFPKRPRGRPRLYEAGTSPFFTALSPEQRARLEKVAAREKRSLTSMGAILIEEALNAREQGQ